MTEVNIPEMWNKFTPVYLNGRDMEPTFDKYQNDKWLDPSDLAQINRVVVDGVECVEVFINIQGNMLPSDKPLLVVALYEIANNLMNFPIPEPVTT